MINWIHLSKARKQTILAQVSNSLDGIPEAVIEKDAWVTLILEALFTLPEIGQHLVFKGGTSLSKAYNLIGRFSEDIDFALNRKLFPQFPQGELSGNKIRELRKASAEFMRSQLIPKLSAQLVSMGLKESDFEISYSADAVSDADPLPVYVAYKSVTTPASYLNDRVILEIGARSLVEPFEEKAIRSMIAEVYPNQPFSGNTFLVPTVLPARTFLEKIFLLHEQFLWPDIPRPKNRMSRHLYDLEKLMDTEHATGAFADKQLFGHIVTHRRKMNPVKGISYEQHTPAGLCILPPPEVLPFWKADYNSFIGSMVIGSRLSFEELYSRIEILQDRIRAISWT